MLVVAFLTIETGCMQSVRVNMLSCGYGRRTCAFDMLNGQVSEGERVMWFFVGIGAVVMCGFLLFNWWWRKSIAQNYEKLIEE